MSTYEVSTSTRSERGPRTLTQAVESYLAQGPQSGQQVLARALELLITEDNSEMAFELLDRLQTEQTKPVTDEFLESLDRVEVKDALKEASECPICTTPFNEAKHPLIVRLPCDAQHLRGSSAKGHIFDYECVTPWLKEHSTCPMCRFDVSKAAERRKEKLELELKEARENEQEEEEEEEGWEIYG